MSSAATRYIDNHIISISSFSLVVSVISKVYRGLQKKVQVRWNGHSSDAHSIARGRRDAIRMRTHCIWLCCDNSDSHACACIVRFTCLCSWYVDAALVEYLACGFNS